MEIKPVGKEYYIYNENTAPGSFSNRMKNQEIPQKQDDGEKAKLLRRIKIEKVFGYIYLITAIVCIIAVSILWNSTDTGFIRYGIILPIYFIWQGVKSLIKSRDLKDDYQLNNPDKVI